jgi:hypothetical protein
MNTKKPTPSNLEALGGTRLQGEVLPNARWGRLGRAYLSRPLPRRQDRVGGGDVRRV